MSTNVKATDAWNTNVETPHVLELLLVELGHGVEPSVGHLLSWYKDFLMGLWVNDLPACTDGLVD
jgi:hypothetical protein